SALPDVARVSLDELIEGRSLELDLERDRRALLFPRVQLAHRIECTLEARGYSTLFTDVILWERTHDRLSEQRDVAPLARSSSITLGFSGRPGDGLLGLRQVG